MMKHEIVALDTTVADGVDFARKTLKTERDLQQAADLVFETIVQNEIGAATVLATSLLGNPVDAADTVSVALETLVSRLANTTPPSARVNGCLVM
jgi:hypothetical protein